MTKSAKRPAVKRGAAKAKRTAKAIPAKAPKRREPEVLVIDPTFAPVVAAFADDHDVGLAKIMVSVGLRVGGKFFAFVRRGRLVAKLPKARVAALVASGKGSFFDRGRGTPMKEWLTVGAGDADWIALAREARRFVGGGKG